MDDGFGDAFTSAPSNEEKQDTKDEAVKEEEEEETKAAPKIQEPFNADSLLAGFMADVGAVTRK